MKYLAEFMLLLIVQASPVSASQETPQAGVQAIIELHNAGDYATLIRERYTEIYKAEAAGKVKQLIEKYAQRLSTSDKLQTVITSYSECLADGLVITLNPSPRQTETDSMATCTVAGGTLTLYLQKNGKWGFHM